MPDVTLLTAAVSALGQAGPYTWMDLVARALLAIAHLAGLAACAYLIRHRLDLPFSPLFAWFGLFILADSTGLLIDLLAAWQPLVPVRAAWNVVVAVMSVGMTVALGVLLPRALKDGALQAYQRRDEKERLQADRIAELQALDRYKDELLSIVSHELRTPLNFIIGFASLLEEEFVDPLTPAQRTHVSRILQGADRMLGLVDSLLDLARLRSGRLHLSPAELDLQPILEDVITGMRPLAAERGLRLEAELAVPHHVVGDRRWIARALTHMLGNAIKFTPSGRVGVRAYIEGDRAIVEVSDTGPGIAPEDLTRVFERFRQLDMGATRANGGAGLGLAIVKEVVEAHAGELGVRSDLGAGTTFWFSLAVGVACRVPAVTTDDVTAV